MPEPISSAGFGSAYPTSPVGRLDAASTISKRYRISRKQALQLVDRARQAQYLSNSDVYAAAEDELQRRRF